MFQVRMGDEKIYILISILVLSCAEQIDKLPLCPTNIEYFPQSLPMHCRMPRSTDFTANIAGLTPTDVATAPQPSQFYQSPPSDKQPTPISIPVPAGDPIPYPFPGGLPPGGAFPMPIPMPIPGPAHKLPVIVMPFYSPDPIHKKPKDIRPKIGGHGHDRRPRRPHRPWRPRRRPYDTDSSTDKDTENSRYSSDTDTDKETDTDTSDSSDSSRDYLRDNSAMIEERGWWNHKSKRGKQSGRRTSKTHSHKIKASRRNNNNKDKKELLTPVLQYVTKDGYVIFEKKISKGEAKDWLKMRSDDPDPNKDLPNRPNENYSNENRKVKRNNKHVRVDDEQSNERAKSIRLEVSSETPRMLKKHIKKSTK